MRATVEQSSAKVITTSTCSPASTRGSQYWASSHISASGSASSANQRGATSLDSVAWPWKTDVTKTSAVWSQDGRDGNLNSMLARCCSESADTSSPDSSATSRTAASTGFSPGST